MVTFQRRRPAEQCHIRVQITGDIQFISGTLASHVAKATRRDRTINQQPNEVTVHLTDREWTRLPPLILDSVRDDYVLETLQTTNKDSAEAEADAQINLSGQAYARSESGGQAQIGIEAELTQPQDDIKNKLLAASQETGIRPLNATQRSDTEYIFYPDGTQPNTFDIDSYDIFMENLRDRLQFADTRLVCRSL